MAALLSVRRSGLEQYLHAHANCRLHLDFSWEKSPPRPSPKAVPLRNTSTTRGPSRSIHLQCGQLVIYQQAGRISEPCVDFPLGKRDWLGSTCSAGHRPQVLHQRAHQCVLYYK